MYFNDKILAAVCPFTGIFPVQMSTSLIFISFSDDNCVFKYECVVCFRQRLLA